MSRRNRNGRSAARFVALYDWFMNSPAWKGLKPGPRALYVELKRKFNGTNNGRLFLSHRDAAEALNMNREAISGYFAALVSAGFIVQTQGHCLGPSGKGQAATYALTEEPLDGRPATKEFMAREKHTPRSETRHSLAGKPSHAGREIQPVGEQTSENPASLAPFRALVVPENPATSISSQMENMENAEPTFLDLAALCVRTDGYADPLQQSGTDNPKLGRMN